MSYSRRQLEALGEPLGDSATYRKADGGLILGGGGSSAPAPASSTTTTQDLPDWAKGHAQEVLNKGAALTDINQNPYQAYGGNRIAGFDPMQQQAFQGARNMTVAPQIGQATAATAGAGLGGLDVAGQATTGGFQNQVGGYMNPYLQYSLAPQLAEANRQYDISGNQARSQATQAGAFGGSREAIMAAENERNRNIGLSNIVGQGYNTAFGNAQNQYNQNLGTQLQGYGLLGTAAGQLGNLGTSQYQQGMGINQLQAQYGGQQQAQEQRGLDTAYQDFLTQKNYPYQQLSYMSNLIRGTPMGMNTQSQVYQAPPTTAQTVGALGAGAIGLSKLAAKDGGLMSAYADGGEVKRYNGDYDSVTSERNVKSIANFLPKEQVPKSLAMAQQRQDLNAQLALQKQMAENAAIQQSGEDASIQRGLGSAFNSLPPQMQDGVVRAAGGGILAFKDGDVVDSSEAPDFSSMFATRVADPRLQAQLSGRQLALIDYLSKHQGVTPGTREDRTKFQSDYIAEAQKAAGPSPYGDLRKNIQEQLGSTGKDRSLDEAAAYFEAIPAILEGPNALRGLAAGTAKVGGGLAKAAKQEKLAKANLAEAEFKLTDAERKERMGLHHESRAAYDSGQKSLIEADKNATAAKTAAANAIAKTMAANKVAAGSGAGGAGSKEYVIGPAELLPQIVQEHPEWSPEKQKAEARRQYMAGKSAGYQGVETKVESAEQLKAREDFNTAKIMDSKNYRAAKGDPAKIAELDRKNAAAAGYKLPASHPAMQGANTPAPAPAPAPIQAPPNLNVFLDAARKANPGVSDADLTAYYNSKYKK
jgi:hypothetical protein